MKDYEIIKKYYNKILKEMVDSMREIYERGGGIQYKIYIYEDGYIERDFIPYGGNGGIYVWEDEDDLKPYDRDKWLKANDYEERLVYVGAVSSSYFDPSDCYDYDMYDESERKEVEKEVISNLLDEDRKSFKVMIDERINELKRRDELLERNN